MPVFSLKSCYVKMMKAKIRSSYYTIILHVLVWGLLMAIPALLFRNAPFKTYLPWGFFFITNLYHIGLFYLHAYLIYPALLNKRRWWLYLPVMALIIIGSYHLKLFFLRLDPAFRLNDFNQRIIFFPPVAFLLASLLYRIVIDRIRFVRMEKEIRAEQLTSELKFLRSQISPHFLFNMLTNMVALARKKSDLLEPSLIRLSELLRYMLYKPVGERSPLSEEIGYLKNYVELQQLRFGEQVQVIMDVPDKEYGGCKIEPMLLIPFVENAFKHGIGLVEHPFIKISLIMASQQLQFTVTNNYDPANTSKDNNSGIGLENVRNRLKLLYPGRYKLDIQDKDNIYQVRLNLELTC